MSKAETDLWAGPEIDATLARLRKDREKTEAEATLFELVEIKAPWVLIEPDRRHIISDVIEVLLDHFELTPKPNPAKEA